MGFCVHGTHSWYVNVSLVMCVYIYILYVVRIMNLYQLVYFYMILNVFYKINIEV